MFLPRIGHPPKIIGFITNKGFVPSHKQSLMMGISPPGSLGKGSAPLEIKEMGEYLVGFIAFDVVIMDWQRFKPWLLIAQQDQRIGLFFIPKFDTPQGA